MKKSIRFQRVVASIVAVTFCCLCVVVTPTQAALVGTAEILTAGQNDSAREKVIQFIARQDVTNHLQTLGVSSAQARARVDAMTNEEINLLAGNIDELPAGGDALGVIIGAAILIFVVLIITDIMGVTDVFTFIKKR